MAFKVSFYNVESIGPVVPVHSMVRFLQDAVDSLPDGGVRTVLSEMRDGFRELETDAREIKLTRLHPSYRL